MRKLCILILFLLSLQNKAQVNLILNPSFEALDSCSNNYIYVDIATHWENICSAILCQTALANICNNNIPVNNSGSGFPYQWPRTGNGYVFSSIFPPPPTFWIHKF